MRRFNEAKPRRWFNRDQSVLVGGRIGVVLTAGLDGVHYVYLSAERRVVAVSGSDLRDTAESMPSLLELTNADR